jgi:hypothetical protein
MFEQRQQSAPDFAPPLRDDVPVRDDGDEPETARDSLLSTLVGASALRRALSIVPVAIIGYAIAWFIYFQPSQNVTAKPVLEAKPAITDAAASSEPVRQEVAEAKPAPTPVPAPAATPVAPPAPAVTVAAAPPRPLSRDEIK